MPAGDGAGGTWRGVGDLTRVFAFYNNAAHDACNWLVAPCEAEGFCIACRRNSIKSCGARRSGAS